MSQRRLAAIMFTDIVGFTTLMGEDETKALKVLKINLEIHKTLIERFNGSLIKEIGDGILASFNSSYEAVLCAVDIQHETGMENISLRIGIHEGEVIFEGADILGDGVNIASRLEAFAPENAIIISGAVYSNIKNKPGLNTEFMEEKVLKNVSDPVRIYKVIYDITEGDARDIKPAEQKKQRVRMPFYIGIILLILLASMFVIWVYETRPSYLMNFNTEEKEEKSIAVLPFRDLSEDEKNQYFYDGFMEEILNNLQRVREFTVRSRTSTDQYRKTTKTVKTIGEEMNVKYIIEGSVGREDNNLKIWVQLINAKTDEHIWANDYTREMKEIFSLQNEIAKIIAGELKTILSTEELKQIDKKPTENLEAFIDEPGNCQWLRKIF